MMFLLATRNKRNDKTKSQTNRVTSGDLSGSASVPIVEPPAAEPPAVVAPPPAELVLLAAVVLPPSVVPQRRQRQPDEPVEEGTVRLLAAVVVRDETDRPEAVAAGLATVAGCRDAARIQAAVEATLLGRASGGGHPRAFDPSNPFGDGTAGAAIVEDLLRRDFDGLT